MPEKSLSEMPRDLRQWYTKGQEALVRENYDYAIDLFTQVLSREPGLYECRKALRQAQQSRHAGGGGFLKKVFSSASVSPLIAKAQLVLSRNPAEALALAEQVLTQDPTNSAAHKIIVEATRALEMPHTAVMSLEVLVKNSPRDKALNLQFAEALAAVGQAGAAEQVLIALARSHPNDNEIAQAIKNLAAQKTMTEGGYEVLAEGEGTFRDALRDREQAVALEQEQRTLKTEDVAARLIQEYETRLQAEPNNLKLWRSLGELYTQKKDFDRALACYERLKAAPEAAKDPALERAIAETIARRFDHAIEQLDPHTPEGAAQIEKLRAEKLAFQLDECRKRVEKFPTDLGIRFEYGQLLLQAGRVTEAIAEFQKAQNNPHKRIAAMGLLAQCFSRRKMFDLAARTLRNAIKEKTVFDEEKKELIYQLGCVLEQMGEKAEALEQFKLIYETDIGYRDVAAKVDAYYSQ